ncbi:MAG: flagellar filament capping protein FliD [Deltaproteobacteria bacterium]|nr:flagellar filament capping protein FliD [Deltaproteobacteria bacterium]
MGLRSSSLTGSITFGGIASGIPTNEIIDQLLQLERRPIDLLEGQKENFESKLSILQDLNSKTLALRDALRTLDNMTDVGTESFEEEFKKTTSTTTASSSHADLAKVTATGSAESATILIEVEQLALNDRHVSTGFSAPTDTITNGTFSVTVNGVTTTLEIDGTNNVIVNGVDTGIDTSAPNDTLTGFVEAINASGANLRSYIVDTGLGGTPYRVYIEGDTGASEQITFGDDLSLNFTQQQNAQNARLALDPGAGEIDIEGPTNVFTDIIQGVSIEALQIGGQDITINVTTQTVTNADAIVTAIQDVVSAYNDVVSIMNEQAEVDPSTNRGGPLIGDSTLVTLKRQLSGIIASQIGSGNIDASIQIGIELDANGVLQLDESELRSELSASLDDVKSFFAGPGSFADQLRAVADTFVDPIDGVLVTRIQGTTKTIAGLVSSIADAEERLVRVEENLVRQFSALERLVSNLQQQALFLDQFLLASLNR